MEETISLKEIYDILKKRLALIISMMFVGLGIAGIATFFLITPEYSSRAQLIVTLPKNEAGVTNANDVNTNLQMINTYKELITGDLVLEEVQNTLDADYGYSLTTGTIKNSLEVTQNTNSLMFSIQAKTEDATRSKDIANVTAQVFQNTAKDVLNDTVDKISIISNATAEMSPVSPNNKLNLAIGIILGLMIGIGLAFIAELLDKTVKDDKFVTESLEFTVLGVVPNMTPKELTATINKAPTQKAQVEMQSTENRNSGVDARRSRSRV